MNSELHYELSIMNYKTTFAVATIWLSSSTLYLLEISLLRATVEHVEDVSSNIYSRGRIFRWLKNNQVLI
jgi:hypothetical protein